MNLGGRVYCPINLHGEIEENHDSPSRCPYGDANGKHPEYVS